MIRAFLNRTFVACGTAALLFSLVRPALAAPVLQVNPSTLTASPPTLQQPISNAAPHIAQPLGLSFLHRGAFLDGTQRAPWSIGAVLAANSDDPAALGDRSVESVRLATGQFEPSETDLHLPCIGPDWIISRSRVPFPQRSGSIHGPGWFQNSQPQIAFRDLPGDADDEVFIYYGGDRYLEFRRVMNGATPTNTFRGINGCGGAVTFQPGATASPLSISNTTATGGGPDATPPESPAPLQPAHSLVATPASTGPDIWTFHDSHGLTVDFFGWTRANASDAQGPHDARGQLWRITDASGYASFVGHPTDARQALLLGYDSLGRITAATDSAGRLYTYSYAKNASTGNLDRLISVVATKAATEITRVEYTYYSATTDFALGSPGDLKLATITTPCTPGAGVGPMRESTYYRYWTPSAFASNGFSPGPSGSLRLILDPEGCRRIGNSSLDTASELSLATVGATRLGYSSRDLAAKVNRLQSRGLLNRITTFEYTTHQTRTDNGYDYDAANANAFWATRATVSTTIASGFLNSTDFYFDQVGQALWNVSTAASASDQSPSTSLAVNIARDSRGLVTRIGSPESVDLSSYDPARGTLNPSPRGLVIKFNRLAESSNRPDLAGFVSSQGRAVGWNSQEAIQSSRTFLDPNAAASPRKSLPGYTLLRPLPDTITAYPGLGAAPETTRLSYESYSGPDSSSIRLALRTVRVQHAAVPESQNGSNTSSYSGVAFLPNGLPTHTRSIGDLYGSLTVVGYSLPGPGATDGTGLPTRIYTDATAATTAPGMPAFPAGFLGGTLNPRTNLTRYEYDPQGRTIATFDPDNDEHDTIYGTLSDGSLMWIAATKLHTSSSYASPASWGVVNQAGLTLCSGTLGNDQDAPYAGTVTLRGSPASWVNWSSWSESSPFGFATQDSNAAVHNARMNVLDSTGTRLIAARAYFARITSGVGSPHTEYDQTDIGYDDAGRATAITSPAGSLVEIRLDGFGRSVETWRGITNSDGLISGTYYDCISSTEFNPASGRATARELYPQGRRNSADSVRRTDYFYDPYGDLQTIVEPLPMHTVMDRDNLGRVVAVSHSYLERDPFRAAAIGGLSTSTMPGRFRMNSYEYDPLGRVWHSADTRLFGDPDQMSDRTLSTYRWFDPQGRLAMIHGTSTKKYLYPDRVSSAADVAAVEYTIAHRDSGHRITNAEAMSLGNDDFVLAEQHTVLDPTRRFVDMVATVTRLPRPAAPSVANSPGTLMGLVLGGTVSLNSAPNGRVQVVGYKRDSLQNTVGVLDFGNGWNELGTPDHYTTISRANLDDFTPAGFAPDRPTIHASASVLDGLGRPRFQINDRAEQYYVMEYDELDRILTERDSQGSWTQGSNLDGGPGHPCNIEEASPPRHRTYLDGHPEILCAGLLCDTTTTPIERLVHPDRNAPDGTCAASQLACDPARFFPDPGLPASRLLPGSDPDRGLSLLPPVTNTYETRYNWLNEPTALADPSGVTRTIFRDARGRPSVENFSYGASASPANGVDTSLDSVSHSYTACSVCWLREMQFKNAQGQTATQSSSRTVDAWIDVRLRNQTPIVVNNNEFFNPLQDARLAPESHTAFEFVETSPSGGNWGGPRATELTLANKNSGIYFPDEHYDRSDAAGAFGAGPIDIDAIVGRLSRTTNQNLGNCDGTSSDCFRHVLEKTGYFGIWPIPGSGESVVQHPAGGTQDLKYTPLGMIYEPKYPETFSSTGLDPFGFPRSVDTRSYCAGFANCNNESFQPQDTTSTNDSVHPSQICSCQVPFEIDRHNPTRDSVTNITCSGIASMSIGADASGLNLVTPPRLQERWTYDSTKRNWTSHTRALYTNDTPDFNIPGGYSRSMTFNEGDQPITESERIATRNASGQWTCPTTPTTYTIRHDARGNLLSDGRHVFNYNALNQLTGVWECLTSAQGRVTKGHIVAAYTYDGFGHRLTARYDAAADSNNDHYTLDDDPVESYTYDDLWRLRTVTVSTPHTDGTWTSFVREQWFYHNGEDPTRYQLGSDAPVLRRIDRDGDGIFEDQQTFVTDSRGSVTGIYGPAQDDGHGGSLPGTHIADVRYDRYGTPQFIDPVDINADGVVDVQDFVAYIQAWREYTTAALADHTNWQAPGSRWKQIADFDHSGTVDLSAMPGNPDTPAADNADFLAFTQRLNATLTAQLDPNYKTLAQQLGNLPLYAGYWWDASIEMYHVRYRVYRPQWGRWIQRDPLGLAAGWNLYEYVNGRPWAGVDPLGMDGWWLGGLLRAVSADSLGEYTDNFADGASVVFNTVKARPGAATKGAAQGALVGAATSYVITEAVAATGPLAPVVGTVVLIGFTAYTIYTVDQLGEHWNEMTPEQQAKALGELGGGLVGGIVGAKLARPMRAPAVAAEAKGPSLSEPLNKGGTKPPTAKPRGYDPNIDLGAEPMAGEPQAEPSCKTPSKNSRGYDGPVRLYKITDQNGNTYKYGETSLGDNTDGVPVRIADQLRKLPEGFGWKMLNTLTGKSEAWLAQEALIRYYEWRFGSKPPGNKSYR